MMLMVSENGLLGGLRGMADTILAQATRLGRRIAVLVHAGTSVQVIVQPSPAVTLSGSKDLAASSDEGAVVAADVWVQQMAECLQQVDSDPELGLRVPVVVLGSAMLHRSLAVRSEHRVVTHIIAFFKDTDVPVAALQQLMLRAGQMQQVSALT